MLSIHLTLIWQFLLILLLAALLVVLAFPHQAFARKLFQTLTLMTML